MTGLCCPPPTPPPPPSPLPSPPPLLLSPPPPYPSPMRHLPSRSLSPSGLRDARVNVVPAVAVSDHSGCLDMGLDELRVPCVKGPNLPIDQAYAVVLFFGSPAHSHNNTKPQTHHQDLCITSATASRGGWCFLANETPRLREFFADTQYHKCTVDMCAIRFGRRGRVRCIVTSEQSF